MLFVFRGYFVNIFTKHSLYTYRISCKFRVLLMPRKNKPRNPLSFRTNADSGAKCCEMQKVKKGAQNGKKVTRNTLLYIFHFSHFAIIFAYFAISVQLVLGRWCHLLRVVFRMSPPYLLITLCSTRTHLNYHHCR